MSLTAERSPVTVAELVAALDQQRHSSASLPVCESLASPPAQLDEGPARMQALLVVGAHPGAGASTVALALADATALGGPPAGHAAVRLVEMAPHDASGLICAAEREFGPGPGGWHVGRRGQVEIYRPGVSIASPFGLPELGAFENSRLVVDVGCQLSELRAAPPEAITRLLPQATLVVVCRATVPGVRRAEGVLADLAGRTELRLPVVVGVGAIRWPGAARATFGPCLAEAHEDGRVVLVPADRRLEVNGIDADPLPKAVTASAARLLELVWPARESAAHARRGGK